MLQPGAPVNPITECTLPTVPIKPSVAPQSICTANKSFWSAMGHEMQVLLDWQENKMRKTWRCHPRWLVVVNYLIYSLLNHCSRYSHAMRLPNGLPAIGVPPFYAISSSPSNQDCRANCGDLGLHPSIETPSWWFLLLESPCIWLISANDWLLRNIFLLLLFLLILTWNLLLLTILNKNCWSCVGWFHIPYSISS